jgi:hypothetical protein
MRKLLCCYLRFASFCGRDNTSTLDEGIGQGGFSMVDMGNNAHVSDLRLFRQLKFTSNIPLKASTYVRWAIHQGANLVDGEVNHLGGVGGELCLGGGVVFALAKGEINLRLEGSLELFGDCGLRLSAQGNESA